MDGTLCAFRARLAAVEATELLADLLDVLVEHNPRLAVQRAERRACRHRLGRAIDVHLSVGLEVARGLGDGGGLGWEGHSASSGTAATAASSAPERSAAPSRARSIPLPSAPKACSSPRTASSIGRRA